MSSVREGKLDFKFYKNRYGSPLQCSFAQVLGSFIANFREGTCILIYKVVSFLSLAKDLANR